MTDKPLSPQLRFSVSPTIGGSDQQRAAVEALERRLADAEARVVELQDEVEATRGAFDLCADYRAKRKVNAGKGE